MTRGMVRLMLAMWLMATGALLLSLAARPVPGLRGGAGKL